MKTLTDLCASKVLCDIHLIKVNTRFMNRAVLYKLVQKSVKEQKKILAFKTLIEEWPLEYFSTRAINIELQEYDHVIIASLIQQSNCGCIKLFDLSSCCVLKEIATGAFLKAFFSHEPVLSIMQYDAHQAKHSQSYNNALKFAYKNVCDTELQNEKKQSSNVQQPSTILKQETNCIIVRMGAVINNDNVDEVVKMCYIQIQKETFLKIELVNIQMDYLSSQKIVKVLSYVNNTKILSLDLSYNCLSIGSRLKCVCEKVQAFQNLEHLSLAYNNLDSKHCPEITMCLRHLINLKHLNIAWNQFGKEDDIFALLVTNGLRANMLQTIILSGCFVQHKMLHALTNSSKLCCLQKLCLDQNFYLLCSSSRLTFLELLINLKSTLTYLDISSCNIKKENIISICPVICELQYLKTLVLFPNPGITAEILHNEVLPLLKSLKFLETVPPVI